MTKFVVTKSSPPVLVSPSEPTPAVTIRPTSTDKSRLGLSFTALLVFERHVHEPADTIRRALSRALVHYYPLAGRLAVAGDGSGDVLFSCTAEGVLFVAAAAASCTLEDVGFLRAPLVIPPADLAGRYGGEQCGMSDPLAMVQVTEFACGGFVVGVTWNHGVADTCGVAQFLRAVGELASGAPSPSVVPVRYDPSMPDIPLQLDAGVLRAGGGAVLKHVDFAYCDITIPWSFVNRVKAEFVSQHGGGRRRCSVFDVVTAAIWQCRTRAIRGRCSGGDAPVALFFAVNVRKLVGARDGYYGNCITRQVVVATADAVASGGIVDVVKLINDAKERVPEELLRSNQDADGGGHLVGAQRRLYVASWGGLGLDMVDFGGGGPARVIPNMEVTVMPSCFPCLPCSRMDGDGDGGVNVVAWCVTDEHVDVFRAELARLQ